MLLSVYSQGVCAISARRCVNLRNQPAFTQAETAEKVGIRVRNDPYIEKGKMISHDGIIDLIRLGYRPLPTSVGNAKEQKHSHFNLSWNAL